MLACERNVIIQMKKMQQVTLKTKNKCDNNECLREVVCVVNFEGSELETLLTLNDNITHAICSFIDSNKNVTR